MSEKKSSNVTIAYAGLSDVVKKLEPNMAVSTFIKYCVFLVITVIYDKEMKALDLDLPAPQHAGGFRLEKDKTTLARLQKHARKYLNRGEKDITATMSIIKALISELAKDVNLDSITMEHIPSLDKGDKIAFKLSYNEDFNCFVQVYNKEFNPSKSKVFVDGIPYSWDVAIIQIHMLLSKHL